MFELPTTLEQILRLKTDMLCNGVLFSSKFIDSLKKEGRSIPGIREGGAGPAGGMYFRFENGSIVNALVFIGDKPHVNIIVDDITSNNQILYQYITKPGYSTPLYLLENPRFYSQKNQDGIEYRKLALIHGDRVMATTINQRCHYWRTDRKSVG